MNSDFQYIIDTLSGELLPRRLARFERVIQRRMMGLTVVLEGLYDPGNRSAVYRSAEAHGLLHVHVVDPEAAYKRHARQVSRGAEKWLRIREHETAASAVEHLHEEGYRVLVADMHASVPVQSVDFGEPVAMVFGNEHNGVSDAMRDLADGALHIPMRGFAESLNISVAAAIAIQVGRVAREQAIGVQTDLNDEDHTLLMAHYLQQSTGRVLVEDLPIDRIIPSLRSDQMP